MKTICLIPIYLILPKAFGITCLTQLGFRRANARLVFRSIAMRLVLGTQLGYLSNLSKPNLSNQSNQSNLPESFRDNPE